MRAIVTWEGPAESIQAAIFALAQASGWSANSEKTQVEAATYLINAFVRDVTVTNLKLASSQTAEELEQIMGAADSITVSFRVEE